MGLGLGLRAKYQRLPFVRFQRYAYLRQWGDYRRLNSAPCVRYIGWLGHRNIGDEALYQAFRSSIARDALVVPFEDCSPISWVAERRQAHVVLGGGTLINVKPYLRQLKHAREQGSRLVVFGTGVADLAYWSQHDVPGRGDEHEWARVLRDAEYIGVRGPRSLAWMQQHGFAAAEILGDPAVSVAPAGPTPDEGRIIGLNLGSHDPVQGSRDLVFEAVLAFAREFLQRGYEIHFIALHDIDLEAGRRLQRALDDSSFVLHPFDPDVRGCLKRLRRCRFVVGQRLHATVLAAALAIPNLSLSYQPKCLDFLESIDCAELALPTETIAASELTARAHALNASLRPWHERLRGACDLLRLRQSRRARDLGWARA